MVNKIPKPQMDEDSRPFWEGVQREKLMIQYCGTCHKHIFYPRIICPHCFSDQISWVEASGQGIIYSYTVVHNNPNPAFRGHPPYVIAIIELQEGVRILSRVMDDRSKVAIGESVKVIYTKVDDELTLPYFQLS